MRRRAEVSVRGDMMAEKGVVVGVGKAGSVQGTCGRRFEGPEDDI